MREIAYTKDALKALRGMPRNRSRLIIGKIEQLAKDPAALANQIKKLPGRDGCRLRVGDWRVIIVDDGRPLRFLRSVRVATFIGEIRKVTDGS